MRIALAHGASGTAGSIEPYLVRLRRCGIEGLAIQLPLRRAEQAVSAYREQLVGAAAPLAETVIGAQSYGGRVASLLAADEPPAGLVLLCYPLHRPGRADWQPRTEHWPRIGCPVLLLSGERDPLARLEFLREAVQRLPAAELVTFDGVGHSLKPVLEDAMAHVSRFALGLGRAAHR